MECGSGASQMQVNRVLRPTISRVLAVNGSRRCAAVARRIQLLEYAAEGAVLCQLRQIFFELKNERSRAAAAGRHPPG
jgi:hypothetical protein